VADRAIIHALARLDEIVRRLRRECPWDREQDERSIVPHTVEEAYELADAAERRDDRRMLDELGDVLFQVYFLALLLEERGAGDLAAVADGCTAKLIRRHPHVFGQATAASAGEVVQRWDAIKERESGREQGLFAEVPENLPALLHARKLQRRAASSGFDFVDAAGALATLSEELGELSAIAAEPTPEGGRADPRHFHEVGDVLFAAVAVARRLQVDPELALRAASERFSARVAAAVEETELE
jgi:MazG family protein